jgi:hypothetical protein
MKYASLDLWGSLDLYLIDSQTGVWLAMTHLASIALAPLMFENDDFPGSVLLDNSTHDMGLGQMRRADLNTLVVTRHQDFPDPDFIAHFPIETLNSNKISLRYFVLLSSGLNHRVHTVTSQRPGKR